MPSEPHGEGRASSRQLSSQENPLACGEQGRALLGGGRHGEQSFRRWSWPAPGWRGFWGLAAASSCQPASPREAHPLQDSLIPQSSGHFVLKPHNLSRVSHQLQFNNTHPSPEGFSESFHGNSVGNPVGFHSTNSMSPSSTPLAHSHSIWHTDPCDCPRPEADH